MQNLRAQGFVYDLKPVIQGFLLVDEMLKGLSSEMDGDIKNMVFIDRSPFKR